MTIEKLKKEKKGLVGIQIRHVNYEKADELQNECQFLF